jgi:hypothetical protein
MKEELELELVKKYPKILKDYNGDEMATCMAFGIETRDGWYKLLDECMEKIQYFCDLCSKDGREVQAVAAQIKSKFATLRFYIDIYEATPLEQKIIYEFIDIAERKSEITCEICGERGKINRTGWHMTLCPEHTKDKN